MELNDLQIRAAEYNGKHLLVLAGAGTGKTKTIIARAVYLIKEGVHPSSIRILTFTKRAASEIVSRVKSQIPGNSANSLVGTTFHSWCNQLIIDFPNVFGASDYTVIDSDDQVSIMKLACGKNQADFEALRIRHQSMLDLYSFARNTKRNLTDAIKLKILHSEPEEKIEILLKEIKPKLERILREYEAKKKDRKYLDYDDLIEVVANKLNSSDQAREVLAREYTHLLIDEMQDTNPLQWELIRPFQRICSLFCVGDDAQSIYAFRGADFKNIHQFKERVPDSEVYQLLDNYRSTQELLDVSNWILEKSTLNYNKKLRSVRGSGKHPVLLNTESVWDEAHYIADRIIENFNQNGKTYSDHLVLTRSMFYSRPLQAVFIERKIPFRTVGGRGFMEAAHIKDVFSALRVVNNTSDEIAWMRFLTLWPGIGNVKATRYVNNLLSFADIKECIHYLQSLKESDNGMMSILLDGINNSKKNLKVAINHTLSILEERFRVIYAEDWDRKRKPDFPVLEVLAGNYNNIAEFITECLLNNNSLLGRDRSGRVDLKSDEVTISTIHSAKGLEEDICFVLNVSPRVFPSAMNYGDFDAVEEDRRLLYVALTRAKDELYISRNVDSIYAEGMFNENLEEERYFLNSFPAELVCQVTSKHEREIKNDAETNLGIDGQYGLDFS
jgi:DNA helicase-2/ATP-dependent DNA helicase PcrA